MFKNICKLFVNVQKRRDKRFEDFINFYEECCRTLPKEVKYKLKAMNIHPVEYDELLNKAVDKQCHTYLVSFTIADVNWFKEMYKVENFTVMPIDKFKTLIKKNILDIMEELPDDLMNDDDFANIEDLFD